MDGSRLDKVLEDPNPNPSRFLQKYKTKPSDHRRPISYKDWYRVTDRFFRSRCCVFLRDTLILRMELKEGDQPNDCLEEPRIQLYCNDGH